MPVHCFFSTSIFLHSSHVLWLAGVPPWLQYHWFGLPNRFCFCVTITTVSSLMAWVCQENSLSVAPSSLKTHNVEKSFNDLNQLYIMMGIPTWFACHCVLQKWTDPWFFIQLSGAFSLGFFASKAGFPDFGQIHWPFTFSTKKAILFILNRLIINLFTIKKYWYPRLCLSQLSKTPPIIHSLNLKVDICNKF